MMMYGGHMGLAWWWTAVFFLYIIPMAVTVWAVFLLSGIRQELRGIREALRDLADKAGRG